MNPEIGHLYHDSHFSGVSGGALDAREHLRAREVNAREERLLRQQDSLYERAKETCQKRARWEQDSLRRQLRTILERTPTFDRSLETEKERMRSRHIRQDFNTKTNSLSKGPARIQGLQLSSKAGLKFHSQTFGATGASSVYSNRGVELPPLSQTGQTTWNRTANYSNEPVSRRLQGNSKGHQNGSMNDNHSSLKVNAGGKMLRKRFASPDRELFGHNNAQDPPPSPEDTPRTSQTSSTNLSALSVTSSNRGADLRRRSHHAVMAIVRVQTRHERRMREAEAAMAMMSRRRRLATQTLQLFQSTQEPVVAIGSWQ